MQVRNPADYRSILWVAVSVSLLVAQFCNPDWVKFLCPISCYFAIACGTIAHNHNHRATFRSRRLNNVFGHVLTIFYGYPTLMWVPTHNLNHHRFVNRPGDATATWRYTNKHNAWVAMIYPLVSGYFQSIPIKEYIAKVKQRKPRLYASIKFQYRFWIGTFLGLGVVAGVMHHHEQTGLGLYVWIFALFLPAFCSSVTIMFFNFVQHVHTDAWSEHDHSRNFTGWWFNFLFFNNGYHTAHHENPALHWSELGPAHDEIADSIDPRLNEKNLLRFLIRQYVVSPWIPSLGTSQIGAVPDEAVGIDLKAAANGIVHSPHESVRAPKLKTADTGEPEPVAGRT